MVTGEIGDRNATVQGRGSEGKLHFAYRYELNEPIGLCQFHPQNTGLKFCEDEKIWQGSSLLLMSMLACRRKRHIKKLGHGLGAFR